MKKKISISQIVIYSILGILTALTIFPVVYAFFGSFKGTVEFLNGGSALFPKTWEFSNYSIAWKEANFARYTYNSLVMSLFTVLVVGTVASMAAYVLSRAQFKSKKLIMGTLGLVMFVPSVVNIYPVFKMTQNLGLTNSLAGMIVALSASSLPFAVILMTSYMNGISREIDEAAKIDGSSFFQIYIKIIMPLSKPILATSALIAFKNAWNAYLMPLALSLSKPNLRPLTVGVISLKDMGEGISSWNLMIAGSVISILPMIIVYLFLNKFFIEGLTAGSVKG